MESTRKTQETAFLLGALTERKQDWTSRCAELTRLAESADLKVVGTAFQNIQTIDPATIFGKGKVEEFTQIINDSNADVVIVDISLSGSQIRNLSDAFGKKVIDRIMLILDIFARRATTNEGKLQVELAQLKYHLPRISSLSGTQGRFGSGGVGMRGPGETKLELDKRTARENILKLEKEIFEIRKRRDVKRQERNKNGVYKVTIVGYTNAGKSTFLNAIARENIYADDKLFATLDTTSRKVWLSDEVQIILTDTVGFISRLPHELVDAFASTLEETKQADLLLHVIDICGKEKEQEKETVEQVLNDLNIDKDKIITVYTKADKLTCPVEIKENEVLISSKNKQGFETLKNMIIDKLINK